MLALHAAFVALLVGTEAFFTALSVLNVRYGERELRERSGWVRETIGVEDLEAVSDYHRAKTGVSLLQSWVGIAAVLVLLYSGLFRRAVAAVDGLGLGGIAEGVVFLVGGVVLAQLFSWPFDLFDTFVVEEIFEFNEQSPALWLRDKLLGLAIAVAFSAVLLAALLWFVSVLPGLWWAAFWGVFVAFSLAMRVVYPRVIAPLFYDFEPVESGDLRDAVEDVFERAGFACEQVYEMDASSRSGHSNAYFTGFGRTKRVVLFDTLVDSMTREQVQGVLAHELAHWKKAHVWKRMAANALQVGVMLAAVGYLLDAPWLYAMFGVPSDATHAGLALAALWLGPVNRWIAPVENKLYLAHEREADRFAADVLEGDHIARALATLTGDNLANPFPHPWYAAFHYTHPPVSDRIRYVREHLGTDTESTDGHEAGEAADAGDPEPTGA